MNRKKILYLTHRLPFPPDKGDKIRSFHHLDHLALSHDIYCACFVDDPADRAHLGTLQRWCVELEAIPWCRTEGVARALLGWPRRQPLTRIAYEDRAMGAAIERWCNRVEFDVAVAFSACMAPYALEARAGRRVLDLCDVDSRKWHDYAENSPWPLSRVYAREARLLREFEETCLHAFDATMVITDRERQALDPRGRCRTLQVVSNGVNLPADNPQSPAVCGPVIGFVGAMDYPPNVAAVRWFVSQVWPRVRESRPDAQFRVIGRNPHRSIRVLHGRGGIVVTGRVMEIGPEIARCRALVAPLHQAWGMQNKVLEGMAWARPVIATSLVAESLDLAESDGLLIRDDPIETADLVLDLCGDGDLAERIGKLGRDIVAQRFTWENALEAHDLAVFGRAGTVAAEAPARLSDSSLWQVATSLPAGFAPVSEVLAGTLVR